VAAARPLRTKRNRHLDPFAFVIALVAIVTVGRVLRSVLPSREAGRRLERKSGEELEELRAAVEEVSGRLARLEEERDFYRNLLEAPTESPKVGPPVVDSSASDASGAV
jgi:hypothetical protein